MRATVTAKTAAVTETNTASGSEIKGEAFGWRSDYAVAAAMVRKVPAVPRAAVSAAIDAR
jgi:hypothetical protein